MKKNILTILLLTMAVAGFAQRPIRLKTINDKTVLPYGCMDLNRYTAIDTTRCVIRYRLSYIQSAESGVRHTEHLILQIGDHVTKCFTLKRYLANKRYTKLLHTGILGQRHSIRHSTDEQEEYKNAGDGRLSYEIFHDRERGQLTYYNEMPGYFSKRISYTEPVGDISWTIGSPSDSIAGFPCLDATATYGGRLWKVKFSLEIPLSVGPWKLHGLPGAILFAEDVERLYRFEAIDIRQEQQPILMYDIPTDNLSKKQWLRMEKGMYQSPYFYFGNNGKTILLNNDTELDASWSIPYNPIERE